jgi:hypothetical protein
MIENIVIGGKNQIKAKVPLCPACNQAGQKVNWRTVRSLLKEEINWLVSEEDYFICLSRECTTSYYTKEGVSFKKDDLTVPIWFKEEYPVPICYCKNVTDEEILDHVVNKQCCTNIEEIQAHTGANTGKECATKNPTGR